MVESLLRLAGLDWRVPDFSTVCRRQKTLRVQRPYRASTTALDLLVDSTGIKFLGEGACKRKKHGAEYRRQWRKVPLGIDAHPLEIRAIEVALLHKSKAARGGPNPRRSYAMANSLGSGLAIQHPSPQIASQITPHTRQKSRLSLPIALQRFHRPAHCRIVHAEALRDFFEAVAACSISLSHG
jgi:hypothetical protein